MPHFFPARLRRRVRRNLPALKDAKHLNANCQRPARSGHPPYPRRTVGMKQETATPDHPLHVQLRVYALALLLATFISGLHAGILFGLADFLIS